MRASRILATRPERAIVALAELCEERKDEDLVSAPSYVAPRLSNLSAQVPFTVGSQSIRPKATGANAPSPEGLSPTTKFFEPGPRPSVFVQSASVTIRSPPEHMAPKRGKWTSPPPAEAPSADHSLFESQLGRGLQLATSSTEAREMCNNNESSSNSEFLTDEELDPSDVTESDDVKSVKSFTEGEVATGINENANPGGGPSRRPSWHTQDPAIRAPQSTIGGPSGLNLPPSLFNNSGGRLRHSRPNDASALSLPAPRPEVPTTKRSMPIPGPPRARPLFAWPPTPPSDTPKPRTPIGVSIPLPPSPLSPASSSQDSPHHHHLNQTSPGESSTGATVYYQTTVPRSPRVLYPASNFLAQYQPYMYHHRHNITNTNSGLGSNGASPSDSPALTSVIAMNPRSEDPALEAGPNTPTPYSSSHSHSLSSTTITAPTPPPYISSLKVTSTNNGSNGPPLANSNMKPPSPTSTSHPPRSKRNSRSTSPPQYHFHSHALSQLAIDSHTPDNSQTDNTPSSPQPSSGSSPTPSTSTGYATSISRSPSPTLPSPTSPVPPPTATPFTVQVQTQAQAKDTEKKKRLVFGSASVPDYDTGSAEA
jgi:terminal uridylyltransferase